MGPSERGEHHLLESTMSDMLIHAWGHLGSTLRFPPARRRLRFLGFLRVWTSLCHRQTPCPMGAVGVTVTPHWINGILNTPALIWIRGRETVASPNKKKKLGEASRPGSTAAHASESSISTSSTRFCDPKTGSVVRSQWCVGGSAECFPCILHLHTGSDYIFQGRVSA